MPFFDLQEVLVIVELIEMIKIPSFCQIIVESKLMFMVIQGVPHGISQKFNRISIDGVRRAGPPRSG